MTNIQKKKNKKDYIYHKTAGGLNIIYRYADSNVEYCGVDVAVGSRNEEPSQYGLAHFIEHSLFKGTQKHKASYIANRMEQVGGELNAYTTKDETVIYSTFPKGNLNRAVTLISDLVINSVFPEEQLNRERDVVLDEIDSYRDAPADAIYDDFEEYLFQGTSLAHNILGNKNTIYTFDSEVCKNFMKKYYVASNMVFFYMGATQAEKVFGIVEKCFADLNSGAVRTDSSEICSLQKNVSFRKEEHIDCHQSHTIVGCTIPGAKSKAKYSLALLTNMLGGPGMNARLNTVLREKRGLVYNIDASTVFYRDCGEFTIYFGCDKEDTNKCLSLINSEIAKVANGISQVQLDKARKQYLGQLIVASENKEQLTLSTAHEYLFNVLSQPESPEPISSHIEDINAITCSDIEEAARIISPDKLSILTFV